jgi:hypothetical protein
LEEVAGLREVADADAGAGRRWEEDGKKMGRRWRELGETRRR